MNPDALKFLHDIIDSINKIEFHLSKISTISEYSSDVTISDAVERRLAIIGEALWKVIKIDDTITITDQKKIISLRHILVHDYDLIDDATIFRICQNNLPILKQEILNLLGK